MRFDKLPPELEARVVGEFGHDPDAPAQRQIRAAVNAARNATETHAAPANARNDANGHEYTPTSPSGRVVRLTLPEAPSGNRYWRKRRNGTIYKSDAAESYIKHVREHYVGYTFNGPIGVSVSWYRGRRSGDLDNRNKVLLDALQGVVYADDAQIEELHAFRYEDKHNPRMEIVVWSLS